MSSSHLFLGLPIALLVLYLELSSGFHSAAFFFNHLSLGDVAILSTNFHFIFCVSCSSIESLRVPSFPLHLQCFSLRTQSSLLLQSQLYQFPRQHRLQMILHCPRHSESLCSGHLRFHLLWAQYLVSHSFCISFFVWMMSRRILRCVD